MTRSFVGGQNPLQSSIEGEKYPDLPDVFQSLIFNSAAFSPPEKILSKQHSQKKPKNLRRFSPNKIAKNHSTNTKNPKICQQIIKSREILEKTCLLTSHRYPRLGFFPKKIFSPGENVFETIFFVTPAKT